MNPLGLPGTVLPDAGLDPMNIAYKEQQRRQGILDKKQADKAADNIDFSKAWYRDHPGIIQGVNDYYVALTNLKKKGGDPWEPGSQAYAERMKLKTGLQAQIAASNQTAELYAKQKQLQDANPGKFRGWNEMETWAALPIEQRLQTPVPNLFPVIDVDTPIRAAVKSTDPYKTSGVGGGRVYSEEGYKPEQIESIIAGVGALPENAGEYNFQYRDALKKDPQIDVQVNEFYTQHPELKAKDPAIRYQTMLRYPDYAVKRKDISGISGEGTGSATQQKENTQIFAGEMNMIAHPDLNDKIWQTPGIEKNGDPLWWTTVTNGRDVKTKGRAERAEGWLHNPKTQQWAWITESVMPKSGNIKDIDPNNPNINWVGYEQMLSESAKHPQATGEQNEGQYRKTMEDQYGWQTQDSKLIGRGEGKGKEYGKVMEAQTKELRDKLSGLSRATGGEVSVSGRVQVKDPNSGKIVVVDSPKLSVVESNGGLELRVVTKQGVTQKYAFNSVDQLNAMLETITPEVAVPGKGTTGGAGQSTTVNKGGKKLY